MTKYILIIFLTINLNAIIFKADIRRTDCNSSTKCLSIAQGIIASKIYSKVSSKSEVIRIANDKLHKVSYYQNIQVSSDDIPLIMVKKNRYESNSIYIVYELDSSISGIHYRSKAMSLIKDIDKLIDNINICNTYVEKKELYQKLLNIYKEFELHKLISNLMGFLLYAKPKEEYSDILYKYKELEKDFRRKRPYKSSGLIDFKEAD